MRKEGIRDPRKKKEIVIGRIRRTIQNNSEQFQLVKKTELMIN